MASNLKICIAVDSEGGFAKNHQIPWYIPEDFKHFIHTTKHHTCIMGKHTYLEMVDMKKNALGERYNPNDPILSNRESYVISSSLEQSNHQDATIITKSELPSVLSSQPNDIFILGGERLYGEFVDQVDEIILTYIPHNFGCDMFFKKGIELMLDTEKSTLIKELCIHPDYGTIQVFSIKP